MKRMRNVTTADLSFLVTGGAGYVGSQVCVDIKRAFPWARVVVLDDFSAGTFARGDFLQRYYGAELLVADLRDSARYSSALAKYSNLNVIHCAALKNGVASFEEKEDYYSVNVDGTLALLGVLNPDSVQSFLFSSSAAVYGPGTGSAFPEAVELKPGSPYGETKAVGERLVYEWSEKHLVPACSLRYFNPIGYGDLAGVQSDIGVGDTALVDCLIGAYVAGGQFTVFGKGCNTSSGYPERDFIDIRDLSLAHLEMTRYISKQPRPFYEVYNVGTGCSTPISELVDVFQDVIGPLCRVNECPARLGDVAAAFASVEKIAAATQWVAKRSVKESIQTLKQVVFDLSKKKSNLNV